MHNIIKQTKKNPAHRNQMHHSFMLLLLLFHLLSVFSDFLLHGVFQTIKDLISPVTPFLYKRELKEIYIYHSYHISYIYITYLCTYIYIYFFSCYMYIQSVSWIYYVYSNVNIPMSSLSNCTFYRTVYTLTSISFWDKYSVLMGMFCRIPSSKANIQSRS